MRYANSLTPSPTVAKSKPRRRRPQEDCELARQDDAYVEAAGPSITRILSSTPRSLNIWRVSFKISPRTSRVTISALVARVPSYHASAEKPVKVPSSRTELAMVSHLRLIGILVRPTSLRCHQTAGPDHPLALKLR